MWHMPSFVSVFHEYVVTFGLGYRRVSSRPWRVVALYADIGGIATVAVYIRNGKVPTCGLGRKIKHDDCRQSFHFVAPT